MEYQPQQDDDEITTLRITKKIRRKLGFLLNGNETMASGLERILDTHFVKS